MKCPTCFQEASNPEALLCEFCGELFKPKAPRPQPSAVGEPPAAQAARKSAPAESVEVAGGNVRVPDCCCCCLAPAQETRRTTAELRGIVTTTYTSWEFPYCAKCYHHTVWWDGSWIAGLIVGFGAFIGLCSRLSPPSAGDILSACLGGGLAGAAVWLLLKPKKGEGCSTITHAVYVFATGTDQFSFKFSNPSYGGLFSDLNG